VNPFDFPPGNQDREKDPRFFFNRRAFGGIPIRTESGENPLLREEEVDQAEIRATVRVRLFDLGVINDMDAYTKVLQGVADGANRINHSEHHYDPAAATMRVYMEWSELYIKASNLAPPGS
jgi:hypothetical protein